MVALIINIIALTYCMYHLFSYKKDSETPYHGIMAIFWAILILA